MYRFSLLLLMLFLSNGGFAQFTDASWQFTDWGIELKTPPNAYGSGISFYDFNHDGWDDLTMGGGESPVVFLQNNSGVLEPASFSIPTSNIGYVQSILWIDFDNDGDADLFITRDNGPVELWENDGEFNFTNIAMQAGLQQGYYRFTYSAWGDYNHDGFPDLYLVLYYNPSINPGSEYANKLYKNNGDGTFTDVTLSSGVSMPPRTTLQPVWVDVNNDGWEDLFLAVDRTLFPNELFLNNQDGTFTNATVSWGVDDYIDGMSAAVGDYNRDGNLDIYVSNNPIQSGNLLYTNNGDETFTNHGVEMHVNAMTPSWGAVWIDHNNNTWEDLFLGQVTINPIGKAFFVSQSGEYFEDYATDLGINEELVNTFNCARGDLNNDGYFDLALSNRSPDPNQLYLNDGGENNFLSVSLEGTISNTDGLGTWIHCYFDGMHLVRYTTNSENFGGQNSKKNIFGLGEATQVDSLVLEWNSGTREVYSLPEINTHHYFTEGASFTQPFNISIDGNPEICPGDSVILNAGNFESYLWNTGDTTQQIVVTEAGTFTVETWNEFGLSVTSFPVEITVHPDPEAEVSVNDISCFGFNDGSVEVNLSNGPADSVLWNHGTSGNSLVNLSAGLYIFSAIDLNGCSVSGEVFINEPSPLFSQFETTDADCFGISDGTAVSLILGGTPPYTTDWGEQNPDSLSAGDYTAIVYDTNGCELLVGYSIGQPDSLVAALDVVHATNGNNGSVSVQVSGGTPPYETEWSTGESGGFELSGLAPGEYSFSVSDNNGCLLSTDFSIQSTTDVPENQHQEPVVFPNPSNGNVVLSGCRSGTSIEFFNVFGLSVFQQQTDGCPTTIHTENLPAGTYLMRVRSENSYHTIQVVLVR